MKDIESKEVEILSEELLESEIKDSTKEEKQKKNKTKSKKEKKVKVKKVKEKKQKENDGNVLKKIGIILLILGLMCVAIGTSIFFITEHSSNKPTKEPPKVEEPKKEAEPKEEKTSFSFIAVGDALIHDGIYYDANTWQTDQDGYYIYDFTNQTDRDNTMLSTSNPIINVYRGANLIATYTIPDVKVGTLWDVCTYDTRTNTLTYVNDIYYHEGSSSDVGISPVDLAKNTLAKSFNLFKESISSSDETVNTEIDEKLKEAEKLLDSLTGP